MTNWETGNQSGAFPGAGEDPQSIQNGNPYHSSSPQNSSQHPQPYHQQYNGQYPQQYQQSAQNPQVHQQYNNQYSHPYQQQVEPYGSTPMPGQKSKLAAALLAFFLGSLGIHQFYLGYTGRGIAQLLMNIIGWGLAIFVIGFLILGALYIWIIVDFICIILGAGYMRTDAQGRLLS